MAHNLNPTPTFVIVGGGTSAVTLCCRLSEYGFDVLLIERGNKSVDEQNSLLWPFYSRHKETSLEHHSWPQKELLSRTITIPQGKGIGGTSNINAMIWEIGNKNVFDIFWPNKWKFKDLER